MPLPDIAIPGIQQADLDNCRIAADAANGYAQAAVFNITGITAGQAQANIDNAQLHINPWLQHIYPAIVQGLLQSVVAVNEVFRQQGTAILKVYSDISSRDNFPGREQRGSIDSSLNDLINAIIKQQQYASSLQQQVKICAAQVNEYRDMLAADIAVIASKLEGGKESVNRLNTLLANDPANGTVHYFHTVQGQQSNENDALAATVYLHVMVEQMAKQMQAVQHAVKTMADAWTVLQKKYLSVITELDDAPDEDYAHCLGQLNFKTALIQWQRLCDYALEKINDAASVT